MPEPTCDRCGAPVEDARASLCADCRHELRLEIVRFRDYLASQSDNSGARPDTREKA